MMGVAEVVAGTLAEAGVGIYCMMAGQWSRRFGYVAEVVEVGRGFGGLEEGPGDAVEDPGDAAEDPAGVEGLVGVVEDLAVGAVDRSYR